MTPSVLPPNNASAINADAPIGVFDSGLGGLTVARQLIRLLPNERIVYVADQVHVPYGGRDLTQICGFACGISEALVRYGCKAIVMACNISSATGLPHVRAEHPHLPVLGVIEPGAQQAVRTTGNGRIGVLTTEGTKRSGAYMHTLLTLAAALNVYEVACPDFVPLVESEQEETLAAAEAARRYLTPLQAAGVDTVILGCTHYPFLLPTLQRLAPEITFVDPAIATINALQQALQPDTEVPVCEASPTVRWTEQTAQLFPPQCTSNFSVEDKLHLLTTTGDPVAFAHQLARFLPGAADFAIIAASEWKQGRLHLPTK